MSDPEEFMRDDRLCSILETPEGDELPDRLETLIGLSGKIIFGKYVFPAPAIAHFAILNQRHSPFLTGRKVHETELFEALFLLDSPEEALRSYQAETELRIFLKECTLPEQKIRLSAELLHVKKEFHDKLLLFQKKQKDLPSELAISVLRTHFSRITGFRMLQRSAQQKTTVLNLETLTFLHTLCSRVIPELDQQTFFWILPLQNMAFLLVHALRAKGIKGICRDEKSRQLWEYFQRTLKKKHREDRNDA